MSCRKAIAVSGVNIRSVVSGMMTIGNAATTVGAATVVETSATEKGNFQKWGLKAWVEINEAILKIQ